MMQAEHRDLIEQMARLLEEVDVRAGADFSGVGIIVADSFDSLPLINLRPTNSLLEDAETATAFARLSHHWHEHQDGFHVLTPEINIETVAQYFSPPILTQVRINRQQPFRRRFLPPLFVSLNHSL